LEEKQLVLGPRADAFQRPSERLVAEKSLAVGVENRELMLFYIDYRLQRRRMQALLLKS
jgi:hypothetical protein